MAEQVGNAPQPKFGRVSELKLLAYSLVARVDPVAIVEKSCKVVPITATMNWNDRYGENAKRSWTNFIPFIWVLTRGKKDPNAV